MSISPRSERSACVLGPRNVQDQKEEGHEQGVGGLEADALLLPVRTRAGGDAGPLDCGVHCARAGSRHGKMYR